MSFREKAWLYGILAWPVGMGLWVASIVVGDTKLGFQLWIISTCIVTVFAPLFGWNLGRYHTQRDKERRNE